MNKILLHTMVCLAIVAGGCKKTQTEQEPIKNKTTRVSVLIQSDKSMVNTLKIEYPYKEIIFQDINNYGTTYNEQLDLIPGRDVRMTCTTPGSLKVKLESNGKTILDTLWRSPAGTKTFGLIVQDSY